MPIDPLDPPVTEALRGWRVQHGAGLGLADSLRTCASVCSSRPAREAFLLAARSAGGGAPVESVLEALAGVLSPAERALLAAGWNAGRAEAAMDACLSRRELWAATRRAIRGHLVLPAAVLVIAAFVAPLPAFILGGTMGAYLTAALAPLAAVWLLWVLVSRSLRARARAAVGDGAEAATAPASPLDRLLLKLPLSGHLERQRSLAESAGLLSNLIGAGVTLSEALAISARCVRNGVYRRELARGAKIVRSGQPLSGALREGPLWPHTFLAVLATGEQSGALDDCLRRLGDGARERYVSAVEQVGAWLPRLLYALVGLYVIVQIFLLAGQVFGRYPVPQ